MTAARGDEAERRCSAPNGTHLDAGALAWNAPGSRPDRSRRGPATIAFPIGPAAATVTDHVDVVRVVHHKLA
jgi:hypothetical protein